MGHVLDLQGGFEFFKLFRGHAPGVEVVLAGVLIAGLASGLAFGEHVGHFGDQLDADGTQDPLYAIVYMFSLFHAGMIAGDVRD